MLQAMLVFLGGGLGSIARYLISKFMIHHFATILPLGTLTVNIVGSFIIGLVISSVQKYQLNPGVNLLLATGFCGGFTTFSSFAYDNYVLLKNNDFLLSLSYVFMSLIWGFAATFLGIFIIKKI